MINFEYYNPAKIIFGKGVENGVGREVAKYGKRVLLHYGGGSIKRNGLYDRVVTSLKAEGLYVAELGGVQPNPRLSLVRKGVEICRENRIDFILAVGGGSTIDSSKAIAAAMRCKDEVTFTMPPHQIANGCSDIVAHLMERYFTRVKHVDFTDRLIEGAIRTILYHGPMALENPTDYDVRAEIMWAGTVAHNNLLNTGRIGDWASHDIEHELSAQYDIAHGAGLSIVFPAWMKYVYKTDIDKFVQFAVRVFDVSLAFDDPEKIVFEMIARLESWYRKMGLPTRLSDVGIGEEHLREMAEKCLAERDGRNGLGNFRALHVEDIYRIYKLAL